MEHVQVLEVRESEVGKFRRIDKRLVTLEAMSAECGALLAKVSVKQYRGHGYEFPSLSANTSRNLLSV